MFAAAKFTLQLLSDRRLLGFMPFVMSILLLAELSQILATEHDIC